MDPITSLFTTADALVDEQEDLTDRKHANRDALRAMERAGALTDEQVQKLHTIYPPRKKRDTTAA